MKIVGKSEIPYNNQHSIKHSTYWDPTEIRIYKFNLNRLQFKFAIANKNAFINYAKILIAVFYDQKPARF
jgi:hypothetical protein